MKLPTATMLGLTKDRDKFYYQLSKAMNFQHLCGYNHKANQVLIFSRPGFTKVSCIAGGEIAKTLGMKSHKEVLESLGYELKLPSGLSFLRDDELLTMIELLEQTGDDTSDIWAELERR